MEFGMSTACFFGTDLNEEALVKIAQLGVKNVEVFFAGQVEYEPRFIHQLRSIAQDHGLRVRSVHALPTQFEPQLVSIHPRQYEEALGMYCRVLEAAEMLGASIYVFHGPTYLKRARRFNVNFEKTGERFSQLADLAGEFGVRLCYETVHWCWYHYPEFAPQLLEYVESPNLFFTLDMKQAAQSGYDMCEYIDRMCGRLAHVHVCDYRFDSEDSVFPDLPMRGQADWSALREKLKNVEYDGLLMLEVYTQDYDGLQQLQDSYMQVTQFFG